MDIPLPYVIIATAAYTSGHVIGHYLGRRTGWAQVLKAGLKVKNPEMWDLLHYLVVDSEAEEKSK